MKQRSSRRSRGAGRAAPRPRARSKQRSTRAARPRRTKSQATAGPTRTALDEQLALALDGVDLAGLSQTELEDIRDGIWENDVLGGLERSPEPLDETALYAQFCELFERRLARPFAGAFEEQIRRDLVHSLRRQEAFAGLDLDTHQPTPDELAALEDLGLPVIPGLAAPAPLLRGLRCVQLFGRADVDDESDGLLAAFFSDLQTGAVRILKVKAACGPKTLSALRGCDLRKVEILLLYEPPIPDLVRLLPGLPSLKVLNLPMTDLAPRDAAWLREALPPTVTKLHVRSGSSNR